VGAGLTENTTEIVGNTPEPHEVEVAPPGLSAAVAVHVSDPEPDAVPEIRNTALSPTGNPTSGFLSGGFLNVTMPAPVTTTQPCDAALVTPLIDTI
jgi:hypothetical protein